MPDQVPCFDDATIAALAKDLYGLEGKLSPLVSFEDQNALIRTDQGKFIFKIANKRWSLESLAMQAEVQAKMLTDAPDLGIPQVLKTVSGDDVTLIDGFPVRVLTWIDGQIFGDVLRSPALYRDLGRFMGRFTAVMQGYAHTASDRKGDMWDLDHVLKCKVLVEDVEGEETREHVRRAFSHHEERTLAIQPSLRRSVIHGDANEQNLLAAAEGEPRITGLIDFADLGTSSLVNELAIVLAYCLLDEEDVAGSAKEIIGGYENQFKLEDAEYEVLFDLATMRLVQSIVLTSHAAKKSPDNSYIVKSQQPARKLLKRFLEEPVLADAFCRPV